MFSAFVSTTAENAAQVIIDWHVAIGVSRTLMSDVPTHFKNEVKNKL